MLPIGRFLSLIYHKSLTLTPAHQCVPHFQSIERQDPLSVLEPHQILLPTLKIVLLQIPLEVTQEVKYAQTIVPIAPFSLISSCVEIDDADVDWEVDRIVGMGDSGARSPQFSKADSGSLLAHSVFLLEVVQGAS